MSDKELAKVYEPQAVEEKWYREWEEHSYFHAEAESSAEAYSIVIPPPNVTGALHMGHALNNTLQDILCRWKRMIGCNVPGCPAPTTRESPPRTWWSATGSGGEESPRPGREAFIDRSEMEGESGGQIIGQLKRLGVPRLGAGTLHQDEGLSWPCAKFSSLSSRRG